MYALIKFEGDDEFISYTQNDDYDEYKDENWGFEAEFSEFYENHTLEL